MEKKKVGEVLWGYQEDSGHWIAMDKRCYARAWPAADGGWCVVATQMHKVKNQLQRTYCTADEAMEAVTAWLVRLKFQGEL